MAVFRFTLTAAWQEPVYQGAEMVYFLVGPVFEEATVMSSAGLPEEIMTWGEVEAPAEHMTSQS